MIFIRFITFLFFVSSTFLHAEKELHLETVYGEMIVDDPLAIELIESHAFQRLKHIHQYGFNPCLIPSEPYTRYAHSLGVYFLLHKFNASRGEQIAGLLHDVSHTVFSHIGDYVFGDNPGFSSYQDKNHTSYLNESGLVDIIEKHGS